MVASRPKEETLRRDRVVVTGGTYSSSSSASSSFASSLLCISLISASAASRTAIATAGSSPSSFSSTTPPSPISPNSTAKLGFSIPLTRLAGRFEFEALFKVEWDDAEGALGGARAVREMGRIKGVVAV